MIQLIKWGSFSPKKWIFLPILLSLTSCFAQPKVSFGIKTGLVASFSEIEYDLFNRSQTLLVGTWSTGGFINIKPKNSSTEFRVGFTNSNFSSKLEFKNYSLIPLGEYEAVNFSYENFQIPVSIFAPLLEYKKILSLKLGAGGFYFWGRSKSFFLQNRVPGQPLIEGVLTGNNASAFDLTFVVYDFTSVINGFGLHLSPAFQFSFNDNFSLFFISRFTTSISAVSNIYIGHDDGQNRVGDVRLRSNGETIEINIGILFSLNQ